MTNRDNDGASYIQKFDVENPAIAALDGTFRRLVAITDTQTLSVTQFIYHANASGLRDGDGNRVKTIYPDGSWTAFIGDHYEVDSDGKTRSYYFLGAQRIAMRIDYGETDALYFFHTDHLGSTSLLSNENGDYVDGTEARYLPYGGYRVEPTADLTDHGFTGHPCLSQGYSKQQDEVGLIYMRARFYVPGLGRFLSADTIVADPGNPQSFNRYSYSINSPLNFIDPDGHYHKDVHYDKTYELVYNIAFDLAINTYELGYEDADQDARFLAVMIANGNQWADDLSNIENLSPLPETNHWNNHQQARENIQATLENTDLDPLEFGSDLHAVQDYYAHFGQGYIAQPGKIGLIRSIMQELTDDNYSITGQDLEDLNPFSSVRRLVNSFDWGHGGTSLTHIYDPDEFDPNDPWDQCMIEESEYYIDEYVNRFFQSRYSEDEE